MKNPCSTAREQKEEVLKTSVKMSLIVKDLMTGNKKLAQMGHGEEANGHGAIAAGFQGQRQWTDFMPNGDFMEAILNSSFDWNGNRQPYIVATENDALNGVAMLFGHLVTGTAQVFADVRTYWSPEAVKRVTGYTPEGYGAGGFISPYKLRLCGYRRMRKAESGRQACHKRVVGRVRLRISKTAWTRLNSAMAI